MPVVLVLVFADRGESGAPCGGGVRFGRGGDSEGTQEGVLLAAALIRAQNPE